jgi:hypothetical protein
MATTKIDYSNYRLQEVPIDTIKKSLQKVLESGTLLKLGWIGGIITLASLALFWWVYWKQQDYLLMIQKAKLQEDMNGRDDDAVNDTIK